jgi:hypothetical protein
MSGLTPSYGISPGNRKLVEKHRCGLAATLAKIPMITGKSAVQGRSFNRLFTIKLEDFGLEDSGPRIPSIRRQSAGSTRANRLLLLP